MGAPSRSGAVGSAESPKGVVFEVVGRAGCGVRVRCVRACGVRGVSGGAGPCLPAPDPAEAVTSANRRGFRRVLWCGMLRKFRFRSLLSVSFCFRVEFGVILIFFGSFLIFFVVK